MLDDAAIQSKEDWLKWILDKRPSIQTQLNAWLRLVQTLEPGRQNNWSSHQLNEEDAAVLMRNGTNDVSGRCLVIASVRLPPPFQRRGWFKAFLSECCRENPWPQLVIEDVENPHLRGFLERLNCRVLNSRYSTTYVVNQQEVLALGTPSLQPLASYV